MNMEMITFKINDMEIEAPAGTTILEAARNAGIDIPTLCYLKNINEIGACRMCVVEVKGARTLMSACTTPVAPGMEVWTDSEKAVASRKQTLTLLCESHHLDCEYCPRYSDCELHAMFVRYGIRARKIGAFAVEPNLDKTAPHLVRDVNRCLMCRRCVAACHAQGVDAIAVLGRGNDACIGAPLGLGSSECIHCGQCITACPTGALFERDETHALRCALEYRDKHVVGIVEPPVWAALGEAFHEETGVNVRGKLAAFLRRIGFEKVYDLSREDDGRMAELRQRIAALRQTPDAGAVQTLKTGAATGTDQTPPDKCARASAPLISAACPGFLSYVSLHKPDWADSMSDLLYPAASVAGNLRQRSAQELGVSPTDIVIVSISACTAQKALKAPDVDLTITTRELAKALRTACVSLSTSLNVWRSLPDEPYDNEEAPKRAFMPLPPSAPGVKDVALELDGTPVKACVVSGFSEGLKLLDAVQKGEASYDYIEVRACPGGCLSGGGQPRHDKPLQNEVCLAALRAKALAHAGSCNKK